MVRRNKNDAFGNRNPPADANMESDASDAASPAERPSSFAAPVRVTFHHTRKRLADIDGLSGKAVLDGIVEAGILADDSPQQVASVTHTQQKGTVEATRIVIEEVR